MWVLILQRRQHTDVLARAGGCPPQGAWGACISEPSITLAGETLSLHGLAKLHLPV